MAISHSKVEYVYGVGQALIQLPPAPIIAQRAPTSKDLAQLGTIWVDVPNSTIYMLASITSNVPNWTTSPGSGVGTFTAVTVDPGDLTVTTGDLIVSTGNVDISAGNLTVGGDLTLGGSINLADLTVTSTQPILLETSDNTDAAIYIIADGGANEDITIWSKQGTSDDSVLLRSDAGGVAFFSGRGSGAADISLTAASGGQVLIHGVLGNVLIEGSGASADAINLTSGGGIVASSTAQDISFTSAAGSINLTATESVADAIVISASGAAGGIILEAGSAGISIGDQADCSVLDIGNLTPTSSRTTTIAGGTVTTAVTDLVEIAADGATTNAAAIKRADLCAGNVTTGQSIVNINSGTAASGTSTVNISTGTGGGTKVVNCGNADGLTTVNIDGITLINDSVNVNTSINTGTSTGAISIGNALSGAIAISGGAAVDIDAVGALSLNSSTDAINIGNDAVAQAVNIATGAAARVITVGNAASDAIAVVGGSTLDLDAAGALSLNSSAAAINIGNDAVAQAINVGTGAAARTLTVGNVTGATAVNVNAGTGGINLSSAGIVTIDAATDTQASPTAASTLNVNVGSATFTGFTTASAASQEFTITNSLVTTSSVILATVCNEGANDAQMTVTRIKRAAGSFVVTVKNNGAAALGGNITITFFVLG